MIHLSPTTVSSSLFLAHSPARGSWRLETKETAHRPPRCLFMYTLITYSKSMVAIYEYYLNIKTILIMHSTIGITYVYIYIYHSWAEQQKNPTISCFLGSTTAVLSSLQHTTTIIHSIHCKPNILSMNANPFASGQRGRFRHMLPNSSCARLLASFLSVCDGSRALFLCIMLGA